MFAGRVKHNSETVLVKAFELCGDNVRSNVPWQTPGYRTEHSAPFNLKSYYLNVWQTCKAKQAVPASHTVQHVEQD